MPNNNSYSLASSCTISAGSFMTQIPTFSVTHIGKWGLLIDLMVLYFRSFSCEWNVKKYKL